MKDQNQMWTKRKSIFLKKTVLNIQSVEDYRHNWSANDPTAFINLFFVKNISTK